MEDKIILYDLTNTYFEGRMFDSKIAKYGRSKEKPIELLKVKVDRENDDHYLWVKSQAKVLKENGMNGLFSQRFEKGAQSIIEEINKKGGTKKIEKVFERIGRLNFKKMMDSNQTCIRLFTDKVQIKNCRRILQDNDKAIKDLSSIFALAENEVRLKILFLLGEEHGLCPCDLSDILGMSIPATV